MFNKFYEALKESEIGRQMACTVEGSEWHREKSTWIHTEMCLSEYDTVFAHLRTPRQILLTKIALLFHDTGKPEAEETLERKDGSGEYRRYAGHEQISGNLFISFCCENRELIQEFFDLGYTWDDIRKIKVIIENHLPFGIVNPQKRKNLKSMISCTLEGEDELCFYDQLYSDCCGRISDNHEAKKEAVRNWIEEFDCLKVMPVTKFSQSKILNNKVPTMFVLIGAPGIGKTTWTTGLRQAMAFSGDDAGVTIVSEDEYRLQFFEANVEQGVPGIIHTKDLYAAAWSYCAENSVDYDKYAAKQLAEAVSSGDDLVLDRTNLTRKARAKWIQAAKQAKYQIVAVEFYASESTVLNRQQTRGDKAVPLSRVREMYMRTETAWFPVEVDAYLVVKPW